MKQCPICDTSYPDEHTTCTTDGAILFEIREWAPGTTVRGKYRVLAKVGKGGMGIVYKATHIVFEEVRALKVMAAHLTADPEFVRRFRREAQVTRKLQHVNVVGVQDFDQAEDGSPFIVMDYIDGVSLRQLLQSVKGPLPVPRALWIARGIAEGLGAAHGLGMVHRDIKPENILLARGPEGRDVPKILDFGIVAMREGSAVLSMGGLLLTPAYGSPEQWEGMKASELDGRADLYALGVTLYEMLAGRLPFHAHTDSGWRRAHLEETPAPPSRFNPELAQISGLDNLILKLLAKDREARPKDAQAFLNELNLLEAQFSWDQVTMPSRRKDVDSMKTVQSRPTGEGGQGIGTNSAVAEVPQAPQRDWIAEKEKTEAEARAKAEAEAKAKAEAQAKADAEARTKAAAEEERARLEKQARSKKMTIGAAIAAVVLAGAIGAWLFLLQPSNPAKLVALGLKYEKGEGVAEDLAKAAELYRQAAEKGDAAGQFHLGTMYRDGDGVPKDLARAADWFEKSARQNNSDAENELGMMYQKGSGKPQDDAQALDWYRKAAEQGNAVAEYNLGWIYDKRGTSKDVAVAASWYRKAADQGNAVAQLALGSLILTWGGDGNPADWFHKAAEQNYGKAQLVLGVMYAIGKGGVDEDPVEAHKWISLAAQDAKLSSDESATANSRKTELESKMTSAQIAEAKKRADDWKAQHPVSKQ